MQGCLPDSEPPSHPGKAAYTHTPHPCRAWWEAGARAQLPTGLGGPARLPDQASAQCQSRFQNSLQKKNTTLAFTLRTRLFGSGQLSQERLSPWRSEGPARSLIRVWAGRELTPGVGPEIRHEAFPSRLPRRRACQRLGQHSQLFFTLLYVFIFCFKYTDRNEV